MRDGDDAPAATAAKPPLKQRLSALFKEYGTIAIVTYFTISILTIIGCSAASWVVVGPSSATGILGVLGAGWAAAKLTLPIRIPITLALTPVVAFVVRRRRAAAPEASGELGADEPAEPPADSPPASDPGGS